MQLSAFPSIYIPRHRPRFELPTWRDITRYIKVARRTSDGKILRTSDGKAAGSGTCYCSGSCDGAPDQVQVTFSGTALQTCCLDTSMSGSLNGVYVLDKQIAEACAWQGIFSTVTTADHFTNDVPCTGGTYFTCSSTVIRVSKSSPTSLTVTAAVNRGDCGGAGSNIMFTGTATVTRDCTASWTVSNTKTANCDAGEWGGGGTATVIPAP